MAAAGRHSRHGDAASASGVRRNAEAAVRTSAMNAAAVRSTAAMRASRVGAAVGVRATSTVGATAAMRTAFLCKSGGSESGKTKRRCVNQDGSENGFRGGWVHDRLPLYPEGPGPRGSLRGLAPEGSQAFGACGQLLLVYETVRRTKRLQKSHSADSSGSSICGRRSKGLRRAINCFRNPRKHFRVDFRLSRHGTQLKRRAANYQKRLTRPRGAR